jgi:ribose transport system permease protein
VTPALPLGARWVLRDKVGPIGVAALLFLLLATGALLTDRFATVANLRNVFEQATDLAIVSLGQTLTILTGGIDLSVGSMISLLACLTSGTIQGNAHLVLPVIAGILVLGVLIGTVNGGLVLALGVHPLIVTLGMGAVLQGITLLYTLGPVGKVESSFRFLAYGKLWGLPFGACLAVLLCALVGIALRYTVLGRHIFAVGNDPAAAELIGLPKRRVILLVYGFSGFCCALTALYLVGRFGAGQPYTGVNYTLASITPVIVGGTLLAGGRGGVFGTLLGAYLIALLNNLLNFMDVSKHYQLVAQALVIILAVSVYVEKRRGI